VAQVVRRERLRDVGAPGVPPGQPLDRLDAQPGVIPREKERRLLRIAHEHQAGAGQVGRPRRLRDRRAGSAILVPPAASDEKDVPT